MKRSLIAVFVLLLSSLAGQGADRMLTATDVSARYFPPTLANGLTGLVIDQTGLRPTALYQASVFKNGKADQVSTICPAIVPVNLRLLVNGKEIGGFSDWKQTLDMRHAKVSTSFRAGGVEVSVVNYALRSLPHAVLTEVEVSATRPADVKLINVPEIAPSLDRDTVRSVSIWWDGGGVPLQRASARYNDGRDAVVATAALVPDGGDWKRMGADTLSVGLKPGQSAAMWTVGAVCSTADFADAWNEADRQVIYAYNQGLEALVSSHHRQWEELWRSDITIEGDPQLDMQVGSALYNLYSSIREGSRMSIPPMGLTSAKYYGHIFWDADTWMLPVLAVLNPGLSRSMVDYRYDRLPAARKRAAAYGYGGAMFPWESDMTGEESTPTFALTGPLEHHITADVARGAWLQFCATADTAWLLREGYPLIRECADFWLSRVEPSGKDGYSIRNVVGADEYAIGVDDDAFTNGAAIRALQYACEAAEVLGETPDPRWADVASRIAFHHTADGIVKEHSAYDGAMTKQADVELLGYPLYLLADDEIERNIRYYASKIDSVGGPAMSHSAMAVNYARMGRGDEAAGFVERAYKPNIRGEFLSISETPGNDETYFMTGAGGLLQAIIFGYAGIDITADGVRQVKSSLPSNIRRITITTPHGTFVR